MVTDQSLILVFLNHIANHKCQTCIVKGQSLIYFSYKTITYPIFSHLYLDSQENILF